MGVEKNNINEVEDYLEITLKCGTKYKVDIEFKPLFEYLDWYKGHYGYLQINVNGTVKRFHQIIMSKKEGYVIDHINRDTSDNRRCNLRFVTPRQNVMNRKQITGKYKGVSWAKHAKKWRATATYGGKQKHLGYFDIEEDAARAYDNFVLENCPDHGYLNLGDDKKN